MLDFIVESEANIPENLKEHYVQDGDKWRLDTDAVSKQDAEGYRKSMLAARDDASKYKSVLSKFGDHSPETIAQMEERLAGLKAGGDNDDLDGRINAQVEARTKNLTRDLTSAKQRAQELEERLNGVTSEYAKSKVEVAAVNAASALGTVADSALIDVRLHAGLDLELNEDGEVVTKETCPLGAGLKARDWLAKKVENLPHWEKSSVGGGSRGGPGHRTRIENPWAKETRNVTEQHRLYKADPGKARALAKAAGVDLEQE